jgi:hypothetical protein
MFSSRDLAHANAQLGRLFPIRQLAGSPDRPLGREGNAGYAIPAECTDRGSDSEAHSEPGPAVELAPPTVPAEQVHFFPASKPATGTALDISLPSIRNTRPCDADNRVFNAS